MTDTSTELSDLRQQISAIEIRSFFADAIPLSLPIAEGVGDANTEARTDIRWVQLGTERFPRFDTVISHLDIHSTSHVELPWSVSPGSWDEALSAGIVDRIPPAPFSDDGSRLLAAYLDPQLVDVVVIDVSDKKRALVEAVISGRLAAGVRALLDERPASHSDLDSCDPRTLGRLVQALRITPDDIAVALSTVSRPQSTILVFYSGWQMFLPGDRGELECPWHPYYFHPFLSDEALTQILDLGMIGVASDATGLSSPLHEVVEDCPRNLMAARDEFFGERRDLAHLHSTRLRLLAAGRLYITNLHFPINFTRSSAFGTILTFANDQPDRQMGMGQLMIIPVLVGGAAVDALPIIAYLRRT